MQRTALTQVVHATPAIRRFARTLGVDLTNVVGTGAMGRIVRKDVQRYVKQQLAQRRTAHGKSSDLYGIAQMPPIDFKKFGPIETQTLSPVKKRSSTHLHRTWLNVPRVTYCDDADITELDAMIKRRAEDMATADLSLTVLPFIIKTLSVALREFPNLNASLTPDGEGLVLKHYVHIGVVIDSPAGHRVPVLRDVDKKGVLEIARELAIVTAGARDGTLEREQMQGGSLSVVFLYDIGGTVFTPIIYAPDVAILGIGATRMTPVWDGGEFVPRQMLPLSLSFDHRVIDGAESAHFMAYLCAQLRDLRGLLL